MKEIILKKNGGWCWFQDERAIVIDDILIFGSVSNYAGYNGHTNKNNIEVTYCDILKKDIIYNFILNRDLVSDDHNAPSLVEIKNKKILVSYSSHNSKDGLCYRISKDDDIFQWEDEKNNKCSDIVCYSNLIRLGDNIYNFHRGEGYYPCFSISQNNGESWSKSKKIINHNGFLKKISSLNKMASRPYIKYISNRYDKIHFIVSSGHPDFLPTNLYHGYIYNDHIFNSQGKKIGCLYEDYVSFSDLTCVFNGEFTKSSWAIDIHLDSMLNPCILFLVNENNNLSYYYGKCLDGDWKTNKISNGGTSLCKSQRNYAGLMALDTYDPNIIYISTNFDPRNNSPLISTNDKKQHFELFRGVTKNNGVSWGFENITQNSSCDNIRPTVAISNTNKTNLLWLRGMYFNYLKYDLEVVGIFDVC